MRWGERSAPARRRRLAAGPLQFRLTGPSLENLRLGGVELLRALRLVVRDRNWRTVPGEVERQEITHRADTVTIDHTVRHRGAEVDFRWTGRIVISPHAVLASFEGEALRDFRRNRIGWCLLHPLTLAGVPVEVERPDGTRASGAFPHRVAPHQPLDSIRALRYRHRGVGVEIAFDGEVFETEDQRNWTDASYKTYGTPLALPFPVRLERGERVAQSVAIRLSGDPEEPAAPSAPPGPETVAFDGPLGAMAALGFGLPPRGPLSPGEHAGLRAMRPAFLHLELADTDDRAERTRRLADAHDEAARLGVPLRVVLTVADPAGLGALLTTLCARAPSVDLVQVFDAADHVTGEATARAAALALRGTGVRLGGGTRAHFAELNRAADLPLDLLDDVAYSVTAAFHAEDRDSVRETLTAQPMTLRQARAIAGDRPVTVGPVGFRARFNAVATGGEPAPAPGELPDAVDPRQASVLGAAWLVGSLAALADCDALIPADAVGRRGVAEAEDAEPHPAFPAAPGEPFPLWTVLAALAPFAGGRRLGVRCPAGLAALGLRGGERPGGRVPGRAGGVALVANLRDEPAEVRVALPAELAGATWWLLSPDPDASRGWSCRPVVDPEVVRLPAPSVAIASTADVPRPEPTAGSRTGRGQGLSDGS